jgi:hypothetical protein
MEPSKRSIRRAAAVTAAAACLTAGLAPSAQAIGGTGEKATAVPLSVNAGSTDLKITILGVVNVPIETTLLPFTDLKLSRTLPAPTSFVSLGAKPTLSSNVYRTGTRSHPYLTGCDRGETSDPAAPSAVQVWGEEGLEYPGEAVQLSAPGSTCGPVAQAITQRAQWGTGSAAAQMLTSYSTAVGVEVAAPAAVLDQLPERTLLTADALSSRSACPSPTTMAPAAVLSISGLDIFGGALRLSVAGSGVLTDVVTAGGTRIPIETASGVDVGVPGMPVDMWFGSGLGRFTVHLDLDDLDGLVVGTTSTILRGAIGLDARLVVELHARKATSTGGGFASASAAALEAEARIELDLDDESYLQISNTSGTGPGRIVLADLTLAETTCGWRRSGTSAATWLDPTLT